MNTQQIVGLAIVAAVYNREWCKDTHFWEMYDDYAGIREDADWHLQGLGIDYQVSDDDISECLWNETTEDLLAELECQK